MKSPLTHDEMRDLMAENSPESTQKKSTLLKDTLLFLRDLLVIFTIVILVRTFLIQPFQISGKSMEPSFHDQEFILLDRLSYLKSPERWSTVAVSSEGGLAALYQRIGEKVASVVLSWGDISIGDPMRGDVVVLKPHTINGKEYFIKRVIGVPWDQVRLSEGQVAMKTPTSSRFVTLDESSYLSDENNGKTFLPSYKNQIFTVPEGQYFVMGDNRNHSTDSRACFFRCDGTEKTSPFLKRDDVVGKVLLSVGCPQWMNILSGGAMCRVPSALRLTDVPKSHTYSELAP